VRKTDTQTNCGKNPTPAIAVGIVNCMQPDSSKLSAQHSNYVCGSVIALKVFSLLILKVAPATWIHGRA